MTPALLEAVRFVIRDLDAVLASQAALFATHDLPAVGAQRREIGIPRLGELELRAGPQRVVPDRVPPGLQGGAEPLGIQRPLGQVGEDEDLPRQRCERHREGGHVSSGNGGRVELVRTAHIPHRPRHRLHPHPMEALPAQADR